MKSEVATEAIKTAPPAVVSWLTLNEVLIVVSIAYAVLQAAYLLRKWWREERGGK